MQRGSLVLPCLLLSCLSRPPPSLLPCPTQSQASSNPTATTQCNAAGGMMAKVVKRNSTIPVLQEKEFTTCVDNQSVVRLA